MSESAIADPTQRTTTTTTQHNFTQMHRSSSYDHAPPTSNRKFMSIKRKLWRRFHVQKSTEEIHRTDAVEFCGTYGHIRKELDYGYHVHYRKERQWLHDAAIEDTILLHTIDDNSASSRRVDEPWLILLTGTRDSRKHEIVKKLDEEERLRLQSLISVDADDLCCYLPEHSTYLESSKELAETLTRKETGYIIETIIRACLQSGRNVMYHCATIDWKWFRSVFLPLMRNKYSARIALLRARPPPPSSSSLNNSCSLRGANCAPIEHLIDQVVLSLRDSVNFCCELWLSQNSLGIRGCSLWTSFVSKFDQHWQYSSPGGCIGGAHPKRSSYMRLERRAGISMMLSTEDNHAADDMMFYGEFAHIRETLDYSYHKNYTHERQKFQDAIIREFLGDAVIKDKNGEVCTTPTEPWIVFTAGAMGAGKGYTMRMLVSLGRFPLFSFVRVDPDVIRRYLPEYALYLHNSPEDAGDLTNKEAGYIAEILTLAGLEAGKNVMVDGSLRQSEWYKKYFQRLRLQFPKLRIAIIHVTAPREAIFRRAAERAVETGRIVPKMLLEEAVEAVPRSVRTLAPFVDYQVDISNVPHAPDVELATVGETWDSFTSRWVQVCAWVPRSQKSLREKSKVIERTLITASES